MWWVHRTRERNDGQKGNSAFCHPRVCSLRSYLERLTTVTRRRPPTPPLLNAHIFVAADGDTAIRVCIISFLINFSRALGIWIHVVDHNNNIYNNYYLHRYREIYGTQFSRGTMSILAGRNMMHFECNVTIVCRRYRQYVSACLYLYILYTYYTRYGPVISVGNYYHTVDPSSCI